MDNKLKMEVPYFQSPNDIFELGLDTYELSVYLYLSRCGNNKSSAFPSYATIAEKTKMSRAKAITVINKLIDKGLIIKRGRKNQSNIYEIVSNLSELVNEVDQGSLPDRPSVVNEIDYPSLPDRPYKEQQYKELIKKETTTTNKSSKENVVVDVNELKNKIESVIKSKITLVGVNRLLKQAKIEDINFYLDNWDKFKNIKKDTITGFFISAVVNKFDIPKEEKTRRKPIQATNYEQRDYDDEFFDNLYDNIKYIE